MDEIVLLSLAIKLGALLLAVEIALLYLRRFDRRLGLEFKEKIVPLLEQNALAGAVYFGLRFAGTVLGLAIAIS